MAVMYCALCARPVEARRQIGVGTVLLAVVTGGLSLLAVPFYAKRCSMCWSTAVSETAPGGAAVAGGAAPLARLAELEKRMSLAAEELEAASTEIERLRTERDFYRQLLENPASRTKHRDP